jgi:hypothetical protein
MYGYGKWQMHELEQGDMFDGMFKEYTAEAGLTVMRPESATTRSYSERD